MGYMGIFYKIPKAIFYLLKGTIPTLGPEIYELFLHWAIWSYRVRFPISTLAYPNGPSIYLTTTYLHYSYYYFKPEYLTIGYLDPWPLEISTLAQGLGSPAHISHSSLGSLADFEGVGDRRPRPSQATQLRIQDLFTF